MADYSLGDIKAIMDGRDGAFGSGSGFLWIILIFLFFLAFSGDGLFGRNNYNNGMSQVERDVLTTSCNTQKEVLESRYTTQLGFQASQAQMAQCCCDLRTAIHAEGEATRGLIQDNTIAELRDRLNTANNALTVQTIVNQVVSQVNPRPIPAYLTCSPYTSAYYGFGCGCGCNNNLV